jgi:hypothetical protein
MSDEEVSMDSVSDFADECVNDVGDEGDAVSESDSDAVTEMDSVPDFIDESETDASCESDTTIVSGVDVETDAASESGGVETEMDSVPDFNEEIEIGASDDGDTSNGGSGANEVEYDDGSNEEDDYVSIEQFQQIAAIPVAEKKHSVNSLANLCVGKILSQAMASHQAKTIDYDCNGVEFPILKYLERLINKFSNPQFRVDLDNVYHSAKVVSDTTDEWFPKYGPVINTLRKYGHVMALGVIDTPSTRVLAPNYFSGSNPLSLPPAICFGYVLTLENMLDITISLCFAINNRMSQMQSTFANLMDRTGELEAAIYEHLIAFKIKYLI